MAEVYARFLSHTDHEIGWTTAEAVIDVSGDQYIDLELEALAMMKRE